MGWEIPKKSTWQFRENLVKCYVFLTYLCRVFGTSTWILQNLIGLGVMPQPSGVFISEMFPSPTTKVSLWFFFFSHQNKAQDLSLTLCLPIWTASCVTYFYPAWSFLADSWGHVLVASELSLDLSKVLMGFLAFFKLLISIFFLLPSSPKRKIHVIHQQLSILLKCSAEGLVFLFARIALPCHCLQNKPYPDFISSALLSPLGKRYTCWLIPTDFLVCLFCFLSLLRGKLLWWLEPELGVQETWFGNLALFSWVTFGRLFNLREPQFSHL